MKKNQNKWENIALRQLMASYIWLIILFIFDNCIFIFNQCSEKNKQLN